MPNENLPAEVSGFQSETAVDTPAPEDENTPAAGDVEDIDADDLDEDENGEGEDGGDTDDDAKKLITSLRRKAARQRVAARTAREEAKAAKEAAEAAVAEAAKQAAAEREQIGRALAEAFGFAPKDETPPDPVEVANAARAQAEEAKAAAEKAAAGERAARVQLAVLRNAGEDVNADALLDSRAFLADIDGLDLSAKDFKDQLKAAITRAVDANPARFRKDMKPAGRSGADLSAGAAETPRASGVPSVKDLIAARRKQRGVAL
ncbi:Uncharacterised protein [Mycobacteroides abscessus subsp. abscessus]|nr:Uncharacterised protein [Mycobacteroides abscessus subsp. abscessus]